MVYYGYTYWTEWGLNHFTFLILWRSGNICGFLWSKIANCRGEWEKSRFRTCRDFLLTLSCKCSFEALTSSLVLVDGSIIHLIALVLYLCKYIFPLVLLVKYSWSLLAIMIILRVVRYLRRTRDDGWYLDTMVWHFLCNVIMNVFPGHVFEGSLQYFWSFHFENYFCAAV